MSILLIHLSDLHIETGAENIFHRWPWLCRAVEADLHARVNTCIIAFGGDAAYAGLANQKRGHH